MQDMSNISTEKAIQSKKVILFSTRFLENDATLFNECTTVEGAFCENDAYCEFFLNDNANVDLKKYLYDEYVIPHLKACFPNDIGSEVDTFQAALEPLISKYPSSLYNTIREERRNGYPHVFNINKYQLQENGDNTDDEKYVPKKDLLRYILSCTKEDIKKIRLDIDCNLSSYDITWRFKLYKLQLPEDCGYSAYAVWSLNEQISHNEFKWYEALCNEILNQEKGNEIEGIYLFLHDKDITSSTFNVRHSNITNKDENGLFSYLQDDIKLNVALFQHNDLIGKVLSSNPKNIKERIELLEVSCKEVVVRGGKLAFLNELSDYVAYWHDGGKENYIKNVETGRLKFGMTSLIPPQDVIENNKSVNDVFYEVKQLIDKLTQ